MSVDFLLPSQRTDGTDTIRWWVSKAKMKKKNIMSEQTEKVNCEMGKKRLNGLKGKS